MQDTYCENKLCRLVTNKISEILLNMQNSHMGYSKQQVGDTETLEIVMYTLNNKCTNMSGEVNYSTYDIT